MSVRVRCDCSQLKNLYRKLNREAEYILFMEGLAKEIAMRLLAKVKKRTPVGHYPKGSGKTGGTLRRGWSVGNIRKRGGMYEVEVINTVDYASHVELGHRTRGHKGWVKGRFMLMISEKEIEVQSVALIERRIMQKLKEVFDGK